MSGDRDRARTNAIRHFNAFANGKGDRPRGPFSDVDVAVLAAPRVWERFAFYLVEETSLGTTSILDILGIVLRAAKTRFDVRGAAADVKDFFMCLNSDSRSEWAVWYRGIRHNIQRIKSQRSMAAGEDEDHTAPAIYPCQIDRIVRAYARKGSQESAKRIHTIHGLWMAGARSSEPRWMALGNVGRFDVQFNAWFITVPQSKVSKTKLTAWIAGNGWERCILTSFADNMVLNRLEVQEDDGTRWLFPDLVNTDSSAKRIGRYVKDLLPHSSTAARGSRARSFEAVEITGGDDKPPDNASAASFRHGVCEYLAGSLALEHCVMVTGHELRSVSAFFEYFRKLNCQVMPGAIILAGWRKPAWSQIPRGPVPASIDVILALGVDPDKLVDVIKAVLQIDTQYPEEYQRDGKLWSLITAAFASIVMYYPERQDGNYFQFVNLKLRDAVNHIFSTQYGAPDAVLRQWSRKIRSAFDEANLHLTGRWISGDEDREMARQRNENRELHGKVDQLHGKFDQLHGKFDQLQMMDKRRCENLLKYVRFMGTDAEIKGLASSNMEIGKKRALATKLLGFVRRYLAMLYMKHKNPSDPMPKAFEAKGGMKANYIDDRGSLVLTVGIVPLVALGARFYYRTGDKTHGLKVGLAMFALAAILDATITVPVFMIPNGEDHVEFFTDPGFWLISVLYVGTVVVYWYLIKDEAKKPPQTTTTTTTTTYSAISSEA
ncbi:hypothetical protein CTAYLR_008284 [Chrysophaeum taylorii]|uniref:Uncharacterized protein n=1 Tax=Chrysophaeum taylorii TaxID=2483200 RepID=A0AAD7U8G9_9STRA|nr:hypothetical protein CTAYLR_008284 [Chrysophaeum taylorii]